MRIEGKPFHALLYLITLSSARRRPSHRNRMARWIGGKTE